MKKILNFRPLFYCFIAFFTAILLAKYIFKTNWFYLSIFIILIFGFLILAIIRKKIKIYICVLVFFTAGLLGYCIEASTYDVQSFPGTSVVTGRVSSEVKKNHIQTIVLENVSVNDEIIDEKVYVYIYNTGFLSVGDIIKFNDKVEIINAFNEDRFLSFNYKNNIRYFSSVNDYELLGNILNVSDTIKTAVKEKLQDHMMTDNVALAYGMLFGDQSEIDLSTLEDYRGSGIAHILSISGLHVGIIVGFLYWLLKRFHVKNIITFIIISVILIFYSYLCDFAVTVIRASIMSVCFLGATLVGKKYDALSSIGFAGILILLFKPLYAFDVGFQLSFGCIIGIAMFYRPLFNCFRKIKFPKFFSSSLSISISAQFFILPVLLSAFGKTSFLSIFINILIIPLFSVAYIFIFISTPLLFLSDFFGNFLWFSNLLMQGINICANFVASLTWSIIPKIELTFFAMLSFYFVIFMLSNYILLNYKSKILVSSLIIFISCALIGISQIV